MCFCQEPAFNTRVTANVCSNIQGNPAIRGWTGKDNLESRYDRDIVIRSQETEKIENSFMLRPVRKNNWPHRRRCGVVTARENLTAPLYLTVSQCNCAHVWTAGTVKPSNRGAEEIQYLRHNNQRQRGRTNHAQLWSERFETKDMEYAGKSR